MDSESLAGSESLRLGVNRQLELQLEVEVYSLLQVLVRLGLLSLPVRVALS